MFLGLFVGNCAPEKRHAITDWDEPPHYLGISTEGTQGRTFDSHFSGIEVSLACDQTSQSPQMADSNIVTGIGHQIVVRLTIRNESDATVDLALSRIGSMVEISVRDVNGKEVWLSSNGRNKLAPYIVDPPFRTQLVNPHTTFEQSIDLSDLYSLSEGSFTVEMQQPLTILDPSGNAVSTVYIRTNRLHLSIGH